MVRAETMGVAQKYFVSRRQEIAYDKNKLFFLFHYSRHRHHHHHHNGNSVENLENGKKNSPLILSV